jgi:hypothetical protein
MRALVLYRLCKSIIAVAGNDFLLHHSLDHIHLSLMPPAMWFPEHLNVLILLWKY